MPGITSKLPEGWERSETNTGIPYYINHGTERTQWDHPEMANLMEEIDGLNNIKYAAYRTAMKLRAIQKKTQLYMVDLPVISGSLDEEGIRDGVSDGSLSVAELLRLVTAIFINQNGDHSYNMDVSLNSELVLNWLLNVYDPGRTGFVQIVSVKVGLAVMCSAKVQDKYRYMFRQLCGNQRYLDKRKLELFLLEMLEIPKYIYESTAFSGSSVEPAIRNCFERVSIPERVSAEEFIEWMTAEPQTIVWLPTLHRLAVSETVKHEAKCNVCKMYPIVGFRYRCLKCFNFDLCQECFWSGRVNKQHKIGHPTQEYCLVSTQKEDIKAFAKVMRNKVSKKKKRKPEHPSKGRFIPLGIEDAVPSDREEDDYVDAPSSSNVFPGAHDKLGNYAARLADHESQEDEEEYKQSVPLPRPSMDDEHHLTPQYTKGLSGEPEAEAPPFFAPIPRTLDSKEKQDLEDLITTLEEDNRALLGEIANIHALQRHSQDQRAIISVENIAEASFLRQQRERLQAREEVLEAHNHQLQVQLHRLRILLQQEEATLSGLITDEENMAVLIASERVKQINSEAKKKARMGDLAQISSFMKSNQASQQLSSAPTLGNATVDTLPSFPLSRYPEAAVQKTSSAVVQPPSNPLGAVSSFPPHTSLSGYPNQTLPSQYFSPKVVPPPNRDADWQSQSGEFRGANISHRGPVSGFSPATAAELGLLDRPDSSLEEIEMSNIVDRMTAAFPLDHHSGIPVDIHNDLFLAASLVGEALQSMVTTVSRAADGDQSRRSVGRNLVEPHYGHDNLGFGDWPRADLEEGDRLSTHSLTGYEYGPL